MQIESFQKKSSPKSSQNNENIKSDFVMFLETKMQKFFALNVSDQIKQLPSFQNEIILEQKRLDKFITNDKAWDSFAKNLIMLISGFGTPFALVSLGSKVFTGRYLFFDNTPKLGGSFDFENDFDKSKNSKLEP